jgi:3-deoxy-D-manno-octulosonic-acid transferase
VPYLLNLVYLLAFLAAVPYLVWQSFRTGKYREGWPQKLFGSVPRRDGDRPCFWLHAVSVGEVNLLPRLVDELRRTVPDLQCVVSTTTRTGMELARKKYPDFIVFYCPMDFTWAVRRAMRRIRPDVLILAELELWPNLIHAARQSGARVAVVNGRLSEASFRGYRRIRPLAARVLRQIDLIAVQDETYAERFRQLGAPADRVRVTGSMKYDGAQSDRDNPATRRLRELARIAADDVVFLAGSTQEPEEQVALDVWRRLAPEWPSLRLILVPRHAERFEAVARMLDASGVPWQRRTALRSPASDASPRAKGNSPVFRKGDDRRNNARGPKNGTVPCPLPVSSSLPAACCPLPAVLLVDVIGELGAWWGTARIAFVGGSLGDRGVQNMIEPAAYGAAVSFGPNTRNFRDIVALMLSYQAAEVVEDGPGLERFARRMLKDPAEADRLGQRARALVQSQQGATGRTVQWLVELAARRSPEAR